ncbi:unnamed protein product [Peniophora sp. CBMAI 1063]|nr:unnamed protein product [Peniophora sp. CBMAI 1063]
MASIHTRSRSSPAWGAEPQRATPRPTLAPIKTCDDDRRWSAVVPPHSRALTFVAIFDPEEGMIGFSGSSLLPLDLKDLPRTPVPFKTLPSLPQTPGFPHDDADSQTLTPGTSTPSQSTPALSMDSASTLRDMQAFLDAYHEGGTHWGAHGDELIPRGFDKEVPRASSTLMGYHKRTSHSAVCDGDLRESGCYMGHEDGSYDERFEDSGYASAGDENSDVRENFDRPQVDSFFVLNDEYPFKSDNERSHFSVTTTSTSRYVPIESPATPEPPATPHSITFRPPAPQPRTPDSDRYSPFEDDEDEDGLDFLSFVKPRPHLPHHWNSSPPPTTPRKTNKLFKTRSHIALRSHSSLPIARPDVVLARDTYNHGGREARATSPSSYSPPKPRLTRVLSKGIMRMRKLSNTAPAPLLRPSNDVRVLQPGDDVYLERRSEDANWVRVDLEWIPRITQYDEEI